MAAKLKNSVSYLYLGLFYMKCYGVAKNMQKAKENFELAAFLNNPDAIFSLESFV